MAKDFIRIGGEIVSAPLNENFRRLRNDISVANANLVFSDTDGIKNTLDDMYAIQNPDDAQVCYVVSSGEMYRYAAGDNSWHKIMDLGQTFRQGFLNSGAVVLDGYMELKQDSTNILSMPEMLVYFKNQPGDEKYLKGMYNIPAQEIDATSSLTGANAYSISVDKYGQYKIESGMPDQDNPNYVYIGTFLANSKNEILSQFVYTLPDMAYTADRGYFLINGGQASGLNLNFASSHDGKVNRNGGYYYDEGINFPTGKTDNYPVDSDNGSNFDLKSYESQTPVAQLYYMSPIDGLVHDITPSDVLLGTKRWDIKQNALVDVTPGCFTIQQHLVTPNGQNIILYGTTEYNSMTDAVSNINKTFGININFPYVEATRIVVGNFDELDTSDEYQCQFLTLGRLAQVGTISPEFSDSAFKIYSGEAKDNKPAEIKFSLNQLQKVDYSDTYSLEVLSPMAYREHFALDRKYIKTGDNPLTDTPEVENPRETAPRVYDEIIEGYRIADHQDVLDLQKRISDVETEIWNLYDSSAQRYQQSIRYRLFTLESDNEKQREDIDKNTQDIASLQATKADKSITINKYDLTQNFTLQTGDIEEGFGKGSVKNEWYTAEKVASHPDVANSIKHATTLSEDDNALTHKKVNPHNISTDDLIILGDTQKIFVTPEEERRIRADKLPDDTIQALAELDAKNIDSIGIDYFLGNSKEPGEGPFHLGDIKNIQFFQDGVDLSVSEDGDTLMVEVLGQMDEDLVMFKNRYSTLEIENPDEYSGYVDKAVNAEYASFVGGIEDATANQYYGTNKEGTVGIHDLPTYVATAEASDFGFTSVDTIVFEPINGSIEEKHLSEGLLATLTDKYQIVYDDGELRSATIDTFKFGDNLSVSVSGTMATINATGNGSGSGETAFANLVDVDVTYTGGEGKVLVVNDKGNGITLGNLPSVDEYMLKGIYVDKDKPSQVKKATLADTATLALSANNSLAVNNKSVDDSKTTNSYLWTAEKIISNTSSQIAAEGVNTYSGSSVPSDSLGKNGDLYILIES